MDRPSQEGHCLNTKKLSSEVYVAQDSASKVNRKYLNFLKEQALLSTKNKCRLLLHSNIDERLHEMLIVHAQAQYICPHKNVDSHKSHHIIEGQMAYIIFDDTGNITDHFIMGSAQTDDIFMIRLSDAKYHTMIPLTQTVAYIETILGPFKGASYAPWAPSEQDIEAGKEYLKNVCTKIGIDLP